MTTDEIDVSRLYKDNFRDIRFLPATCIFCRERRWCFVFLDNEAYGFESICEECLQAAITQLRQTKAKTK